jgi:hypothetical protein
MQNTVDTLGDALVLDTHRTPGGLTAAYRRIREAVGPFYGSVNTFRKFLDADTAEDMDEIDRFRIWLLVTSYGKNPTAYGVNDNDVPPTVTDIAALRRKLVGPEGLEPPASSVESRRSGTVTQLRPAA